MNPYQSPPESSEAIAQHGIKPIPGASHLSVLRRIFCVHVAFVAASIAFEVVAVPTVAIALFPVSNYASIVVSLLFAAAMVVAASVESALDTDMRFRAVSLDIVFTVLHLCALLVFLN